MQNPLLLSAIFYFVAFAIIGVFLKIRPNYRQDVMYILGNIATLYKNYIHWSISKLIIYAYGWILAITISAPFLSLMVLFLYKTSGIVKTERINTYLTENRIDYGVVTALLQHPFLIGSSIIIFILIFVIFVASFMYAYFLQQKVYIKYLEGEKLPFLSNSYLDWKLMLKYFGVIFWATMYLLVPIGMAVLYIGLLFGLSKIEVLKPYIFGENLAVGITQMVIFGSFFLYFIYIGLRLSFAYICLLYSTDSSRTSLSYIQESLIVTKGKIWKIIGLGVPFLLISIIFDNTFSYLEGLNSYMPFAMNIIDFFVLSGMSLMIYISFYRIIAGKKVNMTVINLMTPETNIEVVDEQKDTKEEVELVVKKIPEKKVIKKPVQKAKSKIKDIDINKL